MPAETRKVSVNSEAVEGNVASGTMTALIRAQDWSETPIGAEETWSPALRMMVNFLLANRFPLLLWWGPEYVSIYNDAYIPVLGKKHPWALGQPVSKCWEEIWHILQPLIDTPFRGGPPTWSEDLELEIKRSDFIEETHFTVAYSPVPDETAPRGIGGVLATVHEITEKIVGERRVGILRDLGVRATEGRTAEEACGVALETLGQHPKDIPFALVYLLNVDRHTARLSGMVGIEGEARVVAPSNLDLNPQAAKNSPWPAFEAIRIEHTITVDDLQERFRVVPPGPWTEPPQHAVVVPIRSNKLHELAGLLICGVSARLALDGLYRAFFELTAAQIATAIANARAYDEERKRAEALAEIDRAKTLFFSNVSHEFRTPLTLMLGPIEDLLRNCDTLKPQQREHLQVAHRNSLRLLKLVNTLLDFSRIEAGRARPQFKRTDLSAFTVQLASVFRSAMENAGLKYVVDCRPLPQLVTIDRDMWEKIVFNLLSNAFKFTPSGEVQVSLRAEKGAAVLTVRDTGSGIPSWELPNIFKRFHRVENSHGRTHEGTGIGLALAQELVKLHHGTTDVESTLGVGTTFYVRIPFGEKALPSQAITSEPPQLSTALRGETFVEEVLTWLPQEAHALPHNEQDQGQQAIPTLRGTSGTTRPRILVAEDNADMRSYLCRLLESICEVEAVINGAAALVSARKNTPDLILSDVMMPEMDGLELVKTLRNDEYLSSIPIILLSARAGEEAQVEGVSRGADDYLVKPFSARELLARVATHLELARVRRESIEALRESEEQFRRAIEDAPIPVIMHAEDGQVLQLSKTWTALTGYRPEDIPTFDAWLNHANGPGADELRKRVEGLFRGEAAMVQVEFEVLTAAKERRTWAVSSSSPGSLNDGRRFVVEMAQDITERKLTERALRQQTDQYETLLARAPLGVYVVDANLRIRQVNPVAFPVFGNIPNLIGSDFDNVIHLLWSKEYADEIVQIFRRTLETGEPYETPERIEYRVDRKATEYYEWRADRIPLPEGGYGVVCYFRDISAHVKARLAIAESEQLYRNLSDNLEMQVQKRTEQLEKQKQEVVRQSEQLRELSNQLLQIQDDERRHIARELHDSAGQLVTALGISLSTVSQHVGQNPLAEKALEDSKELVQQLSHEIRTTSYLLHPPLLEENGLAGALRWYAEGLTNRSGLDIRLSLPQQLERFSAEMELVMFRFVQECLTNIHRHSDSKTALIRIERDADNVHLEVQDKGQGISSEKLAKIQTQESGVGLRGMQERARHLKGEVTIESGPGGTRVSLRIPAASRIDRTTKERDQRLQAAS